MKLRKALVTMTALTMLFGAAGCKKTSESSAPNENRSTNHEYDFVDYIDIKAYGPDGKGIIEVTPKSYTAADFYNEQEYIQVKSVMDSLSLFYIQGEDNRKSNLTLSKFEDLSNGDIVEVGIDTKRFKGELGIDINTETYEFVVEDLTDGQTIDLFNDESVIIYGLEGTNMVFAHKTPKTATLPKEIEEHIEYNVSTSDTELVPLVTIVNIEATMDEEFLNNPAEHYYNIDIYLKKHGYDYVSKGQTVLDQVISPLEFTQATANALGDYLTARFVGEKAATWSREYIIDRIGNVQQIIGASDMDQFQYAVTFHGVSEDGAYEEQFYATMYLWEIAGELNLNEFSGFTYAFGGNAIKEPMNSNYEILAQYYYTEEELAAQEVEAGEEEDGVEAEAGEEASEEPTE